MQLKQLWPNLYYIKSSKIVNTLSLSSSFVTAVRLRCEIISILVVNPTEI